MAMLFEKSKAQTRQIESFSETLEECYNRLKPYGSYIDLSAIERMTEDFSLKAEDFYKTDRKFNIAVLGQVKAGKSSFLNTLLFNGQEVLPKDSTPKTAVLTRIEYAEENQILVEYYTRKDWNRLERLAASTLDDSRAKAARETVNMSEISGIDRNKYLSMGSESFRFSSYDGLMDRLEEYVGERGIYTPLVKCVTLGLPLDALKEISVVDTPGLNDPVASRTEKTRSFMETCDAAFFLSRSSYFLDSNDVALLTSSLPQKGISHLMLVASQFDSALMDTLGDYDNIEDAINGTKVSLMRHTSRNIDAVVTKMRQCSTPESVISVISTCRRPIFLSALTHRMSSKNSEDFTEQEWHIKNCLSLKENIDDISLAKIGNFSEIQNQFTLLANRKDMLLEAKAASFVTMAQLDFKNLLLELIKNINIELNRLTFKERGAILKELSEISSSLITLQSRTKAAFYQYIEPMDLLCSNMISDLNRLTSGFDKPTSKVDTAIRNNVTVVSDSKLLLPWTWGKNHKEYDAQQITINYFDAREIASRISLMEVYIRQIYSNAFSSFGDKTALHNSLATIGIEILDKKILASQPDFLKSEIEKAIGFLVPPRLNFDTNEFRDDILKMFPRPSINPAEQELLQKETKKIIGDIIMVISKKFENIAENYKEQTGSAERKFYSSVSKDLSEKQATLIEKLQTTDKKISAYQEALESIKLYL